MSVSRPTYCCEGGKIRESTWLTGTSASPFFFGGVVFFLFICIKGVPDEGDGQ